MLKFFRKFLQCRKIWNTLGQNQNLWDRIGIFLHFSYIFLHRKCVHLVPAVRTKNTATTTTVRMTPSNNNDTTTNKFIMVIIWRLIQQQIAIHQQILTAAKAALLLLEEEEDEEVVDGRRLPNTGPRKKRTKFDHKGALESIKRDFLGENTLFSGSQFKIFFRLSRTRFQAILEAVGKQDLDFYKPNLKKGPSLEARLLLPLKTNAYGVAAHTFCDYFQMSFDMAMKCIKQFDTFMAKEFAAEFLRKPTKKDLMEIVKLHEAIHGVPGMLGSLDCMHVNWKNCPKAWEGSFKKGQGKPNTIVLEAMVDYHLWFWHVSFGHPGSLNDLNILDVSPLFECLRNGSFSKVEKESGMVPYKIMGEEFDFLYILVDGIYPNYKRFVKGLKDPLNEQEKKYTAWQESARKDIERAFGVLQQEQQVLARPLLLHNIGQVGDRVRTCLILHNMNVQERVMGSNVELHYSPNNLQEDMERDCVEFIPLTTSNDDEANDADDANDDEDNDADDNDDADDLQSVTSSPVIRNDEEDNGKEEHQRLFSALFKHTTQE